MGQILNHQRKNSTTGHAVWAKQILNHQRKNSTKGHAVWARQILNHQRKNSTKGHAFWTWKPTPSCEPCCCGTDCQAICLDHCESIIIDLIVAPYLSKAVALSCKSSLSSY